MRTRLRAGSEGGSSEKAPRDSLADYTVYKGLIGILASSHIVYRLIVALRACSMKWKFDFVTPQHRNHRQILIDLIILDTNFRAHHSSFLGTFPGSSSATQKLPKPPTRTFFTHAISLTFQLQTFIHAVPSA